MRTTIDIPDAMYRRLKARAAGEGRSAKTLILQGVEQVLKAAPATASRPVTLPIVRSRRPGSLRIDNARIYDVISFPDINAWVALTHGAHVHHDVARDWFNSLEPDCRFHFCRFTQLGLLRLLTADAVMGEDVMNQSEAWHVYDRWLEDDRVAFAEEPHGLERRLRSLTRMKHAAPKVWADAYLSAFADVSQLTLVTFDRALRGKAQSLILLEE